MTPQEFIAKWRKGGDERREWQSFFNDVCALVGHKTPREADPDKTWFTYEYGVGKAGGGDGWADAWLRGRFGWEAKGTGKDLAKAYQQLKLYADDLQNPPLLVVSDFLRFEVHTNFTNAPPKVYAFGIEDLANPETRRILWAVFHNPEELHPGQKRDEITRDAARKFAVLANALRGRGNEPHKVAHFLNRLLFCMFAEDIGLLPGNLFTTMIEGSQDDPEIFQGNARQLFGAMRAGGVAGFQKIEWFNGGLFDDDSALRLEPDELQTLLSACRLDWAQIEPSIFGTLFERGLDPSNRKELGAHYTDPATIMKIIRPVVIEPWLSEWEDEKTILGPLVAKADIFSSHKGEGSAQKGARTRAENEANERVSMFLERLRAFRVLDPACGSGNFLFLSLRALKDIEHRVITEAEEMGLKRHFPQVNPQSVKGIEINDYAAELARITVWIGELQWMVENGFGASKDPILKSLDQVECRDALLNPDGSEAQWPAADVVVGNPPFIGDKKMKGFLGAEYVERLRTRYDGRVSGGANFVCYWFEKANDAIRDGRLKRAGLVGSAILRSGRSREVLQHIVQTTRIFDCWNWEDWPGDDAQLRVAMICFGESAQATHLNGLPSPAILADLTANAYDLTRARKQPQNADVCFIGIQKTGQFEIDGDTARKWLVLPNPNGRPNRDVVRPWFNGLDVVRRPRDMWIVDYGVDMPETEAAMYEAPFAHVKKVVKPTRVGKREDRVNDAWWIYQWPRPLLRRAIAPLSRFIATPEVAQQRVFVWLDPAITPDKNLTLICRDDDTTFGILHSRLHRIWSLRVGSNLDDRPRYTPTSCFETFPFPEGLTPDMPAVAFAGDPRAERITRAARALVDARDRWLNPPEWIITVPEAATGLPFRTLPRAGREKELAKRTLNNLYADPPDWLQLLHATLDEAVAAAYGWEWPLSDDEMLVRLLALNQERFGTLETAS